MTIPQHHDKLDPELQELEGSDHDSQSPSQQPWTPEEERALVRKVDLYLLPTIWLM